MITGARRLSLITEFDEDDLDGHPKYHKKINNYIIVKSLGKGSSSKVFLAVDSQTREKYAIKRLKLRDLIRTSNGTAQLEREIILMQTFNHTNIIKLYEVLYDHRDNYVYLVIEYAEKGSLFRYVENNIQLPEISVCSIIKQINSALSCMHDLGYVHQDVKPGNILLCADGRAILADFGIGHSFQSSTMVVGSPAYQAPEALDDYSSSDTEDISTNQDNSNDSADSQPNFEFQQESVPNTLPNTKTGLSYSSFQDQNKKKSNVRFVINTVQPGSNEEPLIKRPSLSPNSSLNGMAQKEDVWALGVTMYQTLFLKLPFEGDNLFEIVGYIKRHELEFPSDSSEGIKNLIKSMLQIDPVNRISNQQVMQSEIIKNAPDKAPLIPPFKNSIQLMEQEIEELFEPGLQFQQIKAEPITNDGFTKIIYELAKNVSPSVSLMLSKSDSLLQTKRSTHNTNIVSNPQESF